MATLPLLGTVAAGFPSPAEQYVEPSLDLTTYLVKRPAATFLLRVCGASMNGVGILDGDVLVVDRSLEPSDGDIIVAAVDGEFTVKTYHRESDRAICLVPANPSFPTIRLQAGQELDYFGKVIGCVRKCGVSRRESGEGGS